MTFINSNLNIFLQEILSVLIELFIDYYEYFIIIIIFIFVYITYIFFAIYYHFFPKGFFYIDIDPHLKEFLLVFIYRFPFIIFFLYYLFLNLLIEFSNFFILDFFSQMEFFILDINFNCFFSELHLNFCDIPSSLESRELHMKNYAPLSPSNIKWTGFDDEASLPRDEVISVYYIKHSYRVPFQMDNDFYIESMHTLYEKMDGSTTIYNGNTSRLLIIGKSFSLLSDARVEMDDFFNPDFGPVNKNFTCLKKTLRITKFIRN